MRLKDKVVLVTGGAQGMGKEICLTCAREGAKIVVNYVDFGDNEAIAKATKAELESLGATVMLVQANVASFEETEKMFKDVVKEFGRVDVLVNGLKAQLKASNYTLKDYLSAYGIEDETTLRDQYKSSCESTVKVFLIADAIAADKKISVTDEDVKAYFNGEDTAQYEKQYSKAYINRIVLNNLVIQEIEKNVTVK